MEETSHFWLDNHNSEASHVLQDSQKKWMSQAPLANHYNKTSRMDGDNQMLRTSHDS